MQQVAKPTIRVPRVHVNSSSNSPKTLSGIIKALNAKHNIGFNDSTLIQELKEAIRMSSGLFSLYDYWETRLIDAVSGRDDADTILDEFQREAAKLT